MAETHSATDERLAAYVFDGRDEPLRAELTAWLAGSRRFRAFAEANRDKIRKKLRAAEGDEARRDVRAELLAAALLLAERRLELAFEPYGSGRRGPDFSIALGGERATNLEVTRTHGGEPFAYGGPLLGKLRQLPPSAPNVLLIALDGEAASGEADVGSAVRALRSRADRKDEAFFAARGLEGTREFYDRFLRLGAVVVWREDRPQEGRATLWSNGSARIAVPIPVTRAIVRALSRP